MREKEFKTEDYEKEKVRRIDVEESKRQGKIVTKEIDKNDPDYNKYFENVEYIDEEEIKRAEMNKYMDDCLCYNTNDYGY